MLSQRNCMYHKVCRKEMYSTSTRQRTAVPDHITHLMATSLETTVIVVMRVLIKLICCSEDSFISRMICKKSLVLFLFPHTYVSEIC